MNYAKIIFVPYEIKDLFLYYLKCAKNILRYRIGPMNLRQTTPKIIESVEDISG